MDKLPSQGTSYTEEQRREAAVQYAINGNKSAISRALDIPRTTIIEWSKSEWWDVLLAELRHENQDAHISSYHELTRKSLDKANKAIDKLPAKLSAGDIKSLVVTGATATDKARLLMNQPTTISGKSAGLDELAQRFAKIEQDHNNITKSVVSVQDSDSNEGVAGQKHKAE